MRFHIFLPFVRLIVLGSVFLAQLATAQAGQDALASKQVDFSIPSMPLAAALKAYAVQSGDQILVPSDLAPSVRSVRTVGMYTVEAALQHMLSGTGFVPVRSAMGVLTLEPAPKVQSSTENSFPFQNNTALEEIVVTAQGRVQRLDDVPVAVSVVSGDLIDDNGLNNLETVTQRMPSVNISPAPAADFVTIRGVGSSLNPGFEQSVGTFVDGVYRGRARATRAALFDVERVEILKGPQTTFFGNNTIAGAFNIATRKPGDEFEVNAKALFVPEFGEQSYEAGVSVPLSDSFSIRAAGRLSLMDDGYIHNTNLNKDYPDRNDKIGRLSMKWDVSPAVTMAARVDYANMDDKGIGDFELFGCPPPEGLGEPSGPCARYLAANDGKVDNKIDYHSVGNFSISDYEFTESEWKTDIDMGENTLTLTTGFFTHTSYVSSDVLPIPADQGANVISGASHSVLIDTDENFDQYSQEIRLASSDEGFFSYIVGGYWSKSELDVGVYNTLYFIPIGLFSGGEYTAATPVVGTSTNTEKSEVLSAFGAVNLRPADDLRVNLGLRYTTVEKRASRSVGVGTTNLEFPSDETFVPASPEAQVKLLAAMGFPSEDFADPKRRDSKLMPSVSLQYDLTADAMGYVSYTKGFKAGGYAAYGASRDSFEPENVDAYEIGLKTSMFDNSVSLNIAAFYSTYDDLQEAATVIQENGTGTQVVGNVASSVAKGVEVGVTLRPFKGFTLAADLAYLDSIYKDYAGAVCTSEQRVAMPVGCVQDLSGKRRAFAPEYSGNVNARYETSVSDTLTLSMDTTLYFSSEFFQQPLADPYLMQEGFGKVDARIALGAINGSWEVALVGKNLTDKLTASFRQNIPGAVSSFDALPDPPRSVGLLLNLRY